MAYPPQERDLVSFRKILFPIWEMHTGFCDNVAGLRAAGFRLLWYLPDKDFP